MKRISTHGIRPALAALLISLSSNPAGAAEEVKNPFPGLKSLTAHEADTIGKVSYDASLATIIKKIVDREQEVVRLISTSLSKDAGERYFIDFDPGPSADPVFVFTNEKSNKVIARIGADSVFIPGNGFVYTMGRTNNMHIERQKFEIRDGALVEVKQPFSYVGLDSKAKIPLTLTAAKDSGETIANLPKGESLQVVLRDGDYLLIKTPFGLVGWWKMNAEVSPGNEEIEGIFYAGD